MANYLFCVPTFFVFSRIGGRGGLGEGVDDIGVSIAAQPPTHRLDLREQRRRLRIDVSRPLVEDRDQFVGFAEYTNGTH